MLITIFFFQSRKYLLGFPLGRALDKSPFCTFINIALIVFLDLAIAWKGLIIEQDFGLGYLLRICTIKKKKDRLMSNDSLPLNYANILRLSEVLKLSETFKQSIYDIVTIVIYVIYISDFRYKLTLSCVLDPKTYLRFNSFSVQWRKYLSFFLLKLCFGLSFISKFRRIYVKDSPH